MKNVKHSTDLFSPLSEMKLINELNRVSMEHELRTKNQQLDEFAWLTSHRLRASLSRIMGLVNLTESDVELSELNRSIIHLLKQETQAMDEVVKDMNDRLTSCLEGEGKTNREEIQIEAFA